MRRMLAIVVLGTVCGCGGGGAGGGSAGGSVAAPSNRTLDQVLADCTSQNVRDAASFLESLGAVVRADPLDGFVVTGLDYLALRVSWALDADLDGTPEVRGTLRFLDAAGRATLPAGLGSLDTASPALFAALPDGTRAEVTFDLLRFVDGDGSLRVTFAGGLPGLAEGDLTLADGDCGATLHFTDLRLPETADGYPVGTVELAGSGGPDRFEGSLGFDGTNVARIRASVNGGAPEEVLLDLANPTAP